jgi:hypothetical protein
MTTIHNVDAYQKMLEVMDRAQAVEGSEGAWTPWPAVKAGRRRRSLRASASATRSPSSRP